MLNHLIRKALLFAFIGSFLIGIVYAVDNSSETNQTPDAGQKPALGTAALLGFIAIFFIFFVMWVVARCLLKGGFPCIFDVIYAEDGFPSLSRFQFLLWTILIAAAFVWIWLIKIAASSLTIPGTGDIPGNLLILMGISVAVPIASGAVSVVKYPTMSRPQEGSGKKDLEKKDLSTMLQEEGKPSLSRLQMFMWTWIGLLIYLAILIRFVITTSPGLLSLPDIDPTIVILMGISQGSYIGAKLVMPGPGTTIAKIFPDKAKSGEAISILGTNFGDKQDKVWINNEPLPDDAVTKWMDGRIDLTVPPKPANKYKIKIAQGASISNEMDFSIE